jgi:hypothetical protein
LPASSRGDARARRDDVRGAARGVVPDDLVLDVFSRDLPRDGASADVGTIGDVASPRSWNLGRAGFSAAEAATFVPPPHLGARRDVARAVVLRIACRHLVDNVRGQTLPFDAAAIDTARTTATVTHVDATAVTVRLGGAMRASMRGCWPVREHLDRDAPEEQERGYDMTVLGRATFDRAARRFTAFELVAAGARWGATQYNVRADDRAPAPMGVVLTLADDQRAAGASQTIPGAAARS